MSHETFFRTCALAACVSLSCGWASASEITSGVAPQDKPKQEQGKDGKPAPKLSDDERKAVLKINEAKDAAAKLQAASAFLKKYPKSEVRDQVAGHVASKILEEKDATLRVALAELYLGSFNGPGEADHVSETLVNDYVTANRLDDAFRLGATWLEKNPDEVATRTRLAIMGLNMARNGDPKFLPQSRQYAARAIELFEADKKPSGADDAKWKEYKSSTLPQLHTALGFTAYSEKNAAEAKSSLEKAVALGSNEPNTFLVLGLIAFGEGNNAEAKSKLDKAVALGSREPNIYAVLGSMAEKDYTELARKYQAATGPERDATLKLAQAQLDRVIELFAQAVALAEARPEYKPLHDQVMQPLTDYYKYRHNNSTDGLQQLIDKYKKPAGQ